eukprot:76835_1
MSQTPWKHLEQPPFSTLSRPFPINANANEFVVVSFSDKTDLVDGVWKFVSNQNKWVHIFKLKRTKFRSSSTHCTSFNQANQCIYICGVGTELLKINIKTKLVSTMYADLDLCFMKTMLNINDELHMIGLSAFGYKHFMFRKARRQYISTRREAFVQNDDSFEYNLLSMKSRNSVLLFGGDLSIYERIIDSESNEWRKWEQKMPFNLLYTSTLCTKDERYIVVVGNRQTDNTLVIVIYDVANQLFKCIALTTPTNKACYAVIVNTEYRNELSVFGLTNKFSQKYIFATDLKRLIVRFMGNEVLHLLSYDGSSHWNINVNHLIYSDS